MVGKALAYDACYNYGAFAIKRNSEDTKEGENMQGQRHKRTRSRKIITVLFVPFLVFIWVIGCILTWIGRQRETGPKTKLEQPQVM